MRLPRLRVRTLMVAIATLAVGVGASVLMDRVVSLRSAEWRYCNQMVFYEAGTIGPERIRASSLAIVEARLALWPSGSGRLAALGAHLERMRTVEAMARPRSRDGCNGMGSLIEATEYRREAESWLAEAERAPTPPGTIVGRAP